MAFALLSARPNSHPFQERNISLKEAVKIGRAVAKTKPSPNNAVFDCKVLSRNHAIMWYENGKFFLQDTKSSNGTYVNTNRLSRGSEESEPYEIKSNDILQFGVEVVENSKNVTHGCIIGLVTLFHEDGTEALSVNEETTKGVLSILMDEKNVLPQDLWQLCQFLQDAVYREQLLESKLLTLQQLIVESHSTSHDAFQGFIKEDKLLSRLETLENQLEIASKDIANDEALQKLVEYQEEKLHYETASKENLQSILVEKADALSKVADTERILKNTEEECTHLKMIQNNLQNEFQQLIDAYKQQSNELTDLKNLSAKYEEKLSQYENENSSLKEQLDLAERRGSALAVDVESLQAECDFTKQQLNAIKEKFDQSMATLKEKEIAKAEDTERNIPFASEHATLEKEVQNKSAYIQVLKEKLSEAYSELENMKTLSQDQSSSYPLLYQLKDDLLHVQSYMNNLADICYSKEITTPNNLFSGYMNPMANQQENELNQEVKIGSIVSSFIEMVGQVNNVLETITSDLPLKLADIPTRDETEMLQNQIAVLQEKLFGEQIKNKENEENVLLLQNYQTASCVETEELRNQNVLLREMLNENEEVRNKENNEHALIFENNQTTSYVENEELRNQILMLQKKLYEEEVRNKENNERSVPPQSIPTTSYVENEELRNQILVLQEQLYEEVRNKENNERSLPPQNNQTTSYEVDDLRNQIVVLQEKLHVEEVRNKENNEHKKLKKLKKRNALLFGGCYKDGTTNQIETDELCNDIKLLQDELFIEQARNKRNEEHSLLLEIDSTNLQKENETLYNTINILENDCNLLKQDNSLMKKQLLDFQQESGISTSFKSQQESGISTSFKSQQESGISTSFKSQQDSVISTSSKSPKDSVISTSFKSLQSLTRINKSTSSTENSENSLTRVNRSTPLTENSENSLTRVNRSTPFTKNSENSLTRVNRSTSPIENSENSLTIVNRSISTIENSENSLTRVNRSTSPIESFENSLTRVNRSTPASEDAKNSLTRINRSTLLTDKTKNSLTRVNRSTCPIENAKNVTDTNDFHDVVCVEKMHVGSGIDDDFSDESILLGKMGNLVLAFFLLLVGLGALIMLGIIKVTAGTLPLVDERNWVEAWEHIIDYLF